MPAKRIYGLLIGVLVVATLVLAAAWRLSHQEMAGQEGGQPGHSGPAGHAGFLDLSFTDALERAGREGKPVMVFAWADGSGPSAYMEATTFRNPRVLAWIREHTIAVRIDADRQADWAVARGIDRLPITVFVRTDGSEIGRVLGHQPADLFIREAEAVLDGRQ